MNLCPTCGLVDSHFEWCEVGASWMPEFVKCWQGALIRLSADDARAYRETLRGTKKAHDQVRIAERYVLSM